MKRERNNTGLSGSGTASRNNGGVVLFDAVAAPAVLAFAGVPIVVIALVVLALAAAIVLICRAASKSKKKEHKEKPDRNDDPDWED